MVVKNRVDVSKKKKDLEKKWLPPITNTQDQMLSCDEVMRHMEFV